jgi:hypothetical protein
MHVCMLWGQKMQATTSTVRRVFQFHGLNNRVKRSSEDALASAGLRISG